jgi:BRCT domain type II-containing protein
VTNRIPLECPLPLTVRTFHDVTPPKAFAEDALRKIADRKIAASTTSPARQHPTAGISGAQSSVRAGLQIVQKVGTVAGDAVRQIAAGDVTSPAATNAAMDRVCVALNGLWCASFH